MQSQMVDFAPVPPLGELGETHASSLIRVYSFLYENMTSSTKPEVHNIIALPSEEDRATATDNM